MEKQKEFEVFGGEIVRKSFFEYFKPPQWLHGSPYHYFSKAAFALSAKPIVVDRDSRTFRNVPFTTAAALK